MGWFKKKKAVPRVRTDLGTFVYEIGWTLQANDCDAGVAIASSGDELDVRVIPKARALLQRLDEFIGAGIKAIRTELGRDLWDGKGELALSHVDITDLADDHFALTFDVLETAEYTVTVEFDHGVPCEVWGGD